MKRYILFPLLMILLTACDPSKIGPVGHDALREGSLFKLEEYRVNGSLRTVDDVTDLPNLEVENRLGLDSSRFMFYARDLKPTEVRKFNVQSFDVSKDRSFGYYVLKTENGQYFSATVRVAPSIGKVLSLEIGNLMDFKYDKQKDTLRYYYLPVDGF